MTKKPGKFIVSLDFELMWGLRDVATKETYGKNILGVHQVLPKILDCFKKYKIKGTFATVGLLFFETKAELLDALPARKPQYDDPNFSPYGDYTQHEVGTDNQHDLYHYAPHLIQLIRDTPGQEIGTHTFSHFYCLQAGQQLEDFRQDIQAAIDVANRKGMAITSIVFPRNQVNEDYLETCASLGIIAYRGNEASWIYAAKMVKSESQFRRFLRLADSYLNLTGHHCYTDEYMKKKNPVNIPASRFLRPYSSSLKLLEGLKLSRIKKSMTHAAKNGLLYHIWWHPHNFGIHQNENLYFLEKILEHYASLNRKYAFTNYTMSEYAKILSVEK